MAWDPLAPPRRRIEPDPLSRSGLSVLPLAALAFDTDGSAVAVNEAWTEMSGLSAKRSSGDRWLRAVAPPEREVLRARLRRAVQRDEAGSVDCRLSGRHGGRWSRWWWRPNPGGLVVCVADIERDKAWETHLWQRATHDPLTGLVNRSEFLDLVQRAVRRRNRTSSPAAILFIDLDGFKTVNDRGGHALGDQVLREVAVRVLPAIRPADVAARIGGDEFAVLCEDLHGPEEADVVAARLGQALRQTVMVDGKPHTVGATIGVAVTAGTGDTAENLLARADAAMYSAKRAKGCRCAQPWPPVLLRSRTAVADGPDAGGAAGPPASAAGDDPGAPAAGDGTVVDLDRPAGADAVAALVNQMFAVGLTLETVASLSAGPAAARLRDAIDDLDAISREMRFAFASGVAVATGGPAAR
ncbi:MAG TPA: GGDEF domain-containing protein [Acidimicrobiales bacterium]|nr:GGDEF domain-containing protein [Acidimicrobiales bacterium]